MHPTHRGCRRFFQGAAITDPLAFLDICFAFTCPAFSRISLLPRESKRHSCVPGRPATVRAHCGRWLGAMDRYVTSFGITYHVAHGEPDRDADCSRSRCRPVWSTGFCTQPAMTVYAPIRSQVYRQGSDISGLSDLSAWQIYDAFASTLLLANHGVPEISKMVRPFLRDGSAGPVNTVAVDPLKSSDVARNFGLFPH